jgi:dihydropteroate synthase
MGIVNVTPDSFSDGGRFLRTDAAVEHALGLVEAGAAIVDIGGESTRPGAEPVAEIDELARVVPVITAVRDQSKVWISVDTTKPGVARAALAAGADIVNDVSGGRDAGLLRVVAEFDAGLVLMHMLGEPRTMQKHPRYHDVVAEVSDVLVRRMQIAVEHGVRPDAILVDPGIGFGKTVEHNLVLLGRIGALRLRTEAPVLVGASRKSTLAKFAGNDEQSRDDATLAVTVMAFAQGAAAVRVHDVASSVAAARWMESIEVAA